jgi:hypothetical protein
MLPTPEPSRYEVLDEARLRRRLEECGDAAVILPSSTLRQLVRDLDDARARRAATRDLLVAVTGAALDLARAIGVEVLLGMPTHTILERARVAALELRRRAP